jgi:plastocyanin
MSRGKLYERNTTRLLKFVFLLAFLAATFTPLFYDVVPSMAAATWAVNIWGPGREGSYYDPSSVAISVDDTVNWTDMEGTHSASSDLDRPNLGTPASFNRDNGICTPSTPPAHTLTGAA